MQDCTREAPGSRFRSAPRPPSGLLTHSVLIPARVVRGAAAAKGKARARARARGRAKGSGRCRGPGGCRLQVGQQSVRVPLIRHQRCQWPPMIVDWVPPIAANEIFAVPYILGVVNFLFCVLLRNPTSVRYFTQKNPTPPPHRNEVGGW